MLGKCNKKLPSEKSSLSSANWIQVSDEVKTELAASTSLINGFCKFYNRPCMRQSPQKVSKLSVDRIICILIISFCAYFWIIIPICEIVLIPFFGRRLSASIAIKMAHFGLVGAFISDGVDYESAFHYYLTILIPLIAFILAFLFVSVANRALSAVKLRVIYCLLLFVSVVYALVQHDIEPGVVFCLASCSGVIASRSISHLSRRGSTLNSEGRADV